MPLAYILFHYGLSCRVLILHLKRYGYDNLTEEQEKKQDKVNIERFIGLGKYSCNGRIKV